MASLSVKSSKRSSDKVKGTLPSRFYARDTLDVARDLLGKVLVVRSRPQEPLDSNLAQVTMARIVETEAYHGSDPASHSCRGETPRSAIMFGVPGVAYVYFIYGMYEMLNFVTERKGYPGAVLIRAVEPLSGEELMSKRRGPMISKKLLTSGPGRLTQAMGVKMSHCGQPLQGPALYVADDGFRPGRICVSPRVGIRLASDREWRFFIEGNPFVSKAPQNSQSKFCSRGEKRG